MGARALIARGLGRMAEALQKRAEHKRSIAISRRAYSAATSNRLTADWKRSDTTADMEIKNALKVLRLSARDLERNNDYVRRYFNLLIENVVGHKGIGLQVRAVGGDGKQDQYANKVIEDRWWKWGRSCTVCGRYTWLDVQKLVLRSMARDGEILIYMAPSWRKNPAGFALQLIEADHLDLDLNVDLRDGYRIIMGVEIDPYRRPVAYHVLTKHPADTISHSLVKYRRRIPAEDIIHLRIPERVDETRSAPWICSVANRLRHIAGAEEAEVVAWRVAASKMGFYIPGEDAEYSGDDEDENGNPIQEAEPGFFEKLKRGWKFEKWDPDKPSSTVQSFLKAELRGVSSGLNVSYHSLGNDLEGVNFSSIRAGELHDRSTWRSIQEFLIEHLHQIIFERWLIASLTTGFVPLPPWKFEKFNAPVWRPRGWEWVNPADESEAAEKDVANCTKSLYDVAAERGADLDEVIELNKQAKEKAEAAGLFIPAFMPKEASNGKSAQKSKPGEPAPVGNV